jgi:hypothetical protein
MRSMNRVTVAESQEFHLASIKLRRRDSK